MGVYNYTVLKSNPLEVEILIDGIPTIILAYRIKFHGKDTWFEDLVPWVKKKWWPKEYDFQSTYDLLRDKAEAKWGKERPIYGIVTPGYDGLLKFNDPTYKEKGLAVFKIDGLVAWQEDDGFSEFLGRVKKIGKRLVFIPAEKEERAAL